MSYERPAWAGGAEMPHHLPQQKTITIDVHEFVRTRDALTSAYLGLSANIDRAVKAYLDHTQVVLNGDSTLAVGHLLQPFNAIANPAQLAQLALQQNGGLPLMLANGAAGMSVEPDGKGKRKKRAYKQRDPNAPKRPLTAYFRYLGENRGAIQEEIQKNPELFAAAGKPGDISKIATDRWNALTKEQQEPYRVAYRDDLKHYEEAVTKYKAEGGKVEEIDDTKVEDATDVVEPEITSGAKKADEDEDDSSSDEDSSDSDEEEEKEPTPPPPPPPAKTPKSALKKSKQPAATPAEPIKSSSPAESKSKRKAAVVEEEPAKKKRSRKNADKEVVAGADEPTPAAAVPEVSAAEPSAKKKKDKKKRKSSDA